MAVPQLRPRQQPQQRQRLAKIRQRTQQLGSHRVSRPPARQHIGALLQGGHLRCDALDVQLHLRVVVQAVQSSQCVI